MFNPYAIGGAILGAIFYTVAIFFYGSHVGAAGVQSEWNQSRIESLLTHDKEAEDSNSALVQTLANMDAIRIQTSVLIQKVYVHVTPKIDADYPLPWGLVRVYQAGITGADADTINPGPADDAPSPVKASDLAANAASNYGTCKGYAAIVEGLRNELHIRGAK